MRVWHAIVRGMVHSVVVVLIFVNINSRAKKITRSAHTLNHPLNIGTGPNYKHILIEITKLWGLLTVCVQEASKSVTVSLILPHPGPYSVWYAPRPSLASRDRYFNYSYPFTTRDIYLC